jgi:hypothetical protein
LVTRRVPSKGFTMYPTLILLSQVQRSARSGLISVPATIFPGSTHRASSPRAAPGLSSSTAATNASSSCG